MSSGTSKTRIFCTASGSSAIFFGDREPSLDFKMLRSSLVDVVNCHLPYYLRHRLATLGAFISEGTFKFFADSRNNGVLRCSFHLKKV
jgi:hypothetical protein